MIRIRAGKLQDDVAVACGLSQSHVSRAECGGIGGFSVDSARRLFAALGARLDIRVTWRGAALDRLLDERHAALSETVSRLLRDLGWETVAEVSYAVYGERGSIDILAWHAPTRSLLIVEIKTELGSIEETLRRFDAKVRLGPRIALERFGWRAASVSRLLVLPEDRTMRRHVAAHEASFGSVAPVSGWKARTWLRDPRGAFAGMWFLSDAPGRGTRHVSAPVRRVRRAARDSGEQGGAVRTMRDAADRAGCASRTRPTGP